MGAERDQSARGTICDSNGDFTKPGNWANAVATKATRMSNASKLRVLPCANRTATIPPMVKLRKRMAASERHQDSPAMWTGPPGDVAMRSSRPAGSTFSSSTWVPRATRSATIDANHFELGWDAAMGPVERRVRFPYSSRSTYCGYVSFADFTNILSPLSFASIFKKTTLYFRSA